MKICLYGAGSTQIKSKYLDETYELGKEIAKRGHSLVFGGGSTGVMGAVSKGVLDNGGKVIGIAPEWMEKFEGMCKDCDEFISTESMDERKRLFLKHSDAFIIAPGGIGTLDEFFEIIVLKKLNQHNKKIIVFNLFGYYDPMLEMLDFMIEEGTAKEQIDKSTFKIASTVERVFELLEDWINKKRQLK